VAILANGYLSALNELRHCAPLALQGTLGQRMSDSFVSVASTLQNLPRELPKKMTEEEAETFSALCKVVAESLLPHITKCFGQIYPSLQVDSSRALEILET